MFGFTLIFSLVLCVIVNSIVTDNIPQLSEATEEEYQEWFNDMKTTLPRQEGSHFDGNINEKQAKLYMKYVRDPSVKTVCEVGFFQGVSAHLWLFSNPKIKLYSFELHLKEKPKKHLDKHFPGRLEVAVGHSSETLRDFNPPTQCDIVSIDGSHDNWDPRDDFLLIQNHTHCDTLVLFDDTFFSDKMYDVNNNPKSPDFFNPCTASYWSLVYNDHLSHDYCIKLGSDGHWPKGYCSAKNVKGKCKPRVVV